MLTAREVVDIKRNMFIGKPNPFKKKEIDPLDTAMNEAINVLIGGARRVRVHFGSYLVASFFAGWNMLRVPEEYKGIVVKDFRDNGYVFEQAGSADGTDEYLLYLP